MTYNEAIANIVTADYSGLIISVEAQSGYEALADEVIESLKTNFVYPPSFKLIPSGLKKSDDLNEFIETEVLNVDLTKCTKQALIEKFNTLKVLCQTNQN